MACRLPRATQSRLRALSLLLATALGTSWLATQMRERGIIVARTGKVWLERPLLVVGMPGTGTSQMTQSSRSLESSVDQVLVTTSHG